MLISGVLQRHIQKKLIPCYSRRYYAMVHAIREHLEPLGVKIDTGKPYTGTASIEDDSSIASIGAPEKEDLQVAGGFFLLITVPKLAVTVPDLAKTAMKKYDLKFAYGQMFEVKGDKSSVQRSQDGFGNTMRLCWAFHDEEAIVEGIKRLRELLIQDGGAPVVL
jgi:hypothetical protein